MLPLLSEARPDDRPDLRSMMLPEVAALVERLGEKPFRAKQLFRWVHHKGAASLDEMTDLPRPFRERLAQVASLTTLVIDAVQVSIDGTRKYRMRTADGKLIESVYMPDETGGEQAFDPDVEADEGGVPSKRVPRMRTLTTMTAIGGLLPLALQGSSLYSPLAWVIIGGLLSSTLIARLVTPVMYRLLAPPLPTARVAEVHNALEAPLPAYSAVRI